jgi:hypothetical protein
VVGLGTGIWLRGIVGVALQDLDLTQNDVSGKGLGAPVGGFVVWTRVVNGRAR